MAECIASALRSGKLYDTEVKTLLEQFAQERGCKVSQVQSAMERTVMKAIESNPDFASQVHEGLSYVDGAHRFILLSMIWLKYHFLQLFPLVNDQEEACWVAQNESYLSKVEFEIVRQHLLGRSFEDIISFRSLDASMVETMYDHALERIKLLAGMVYPQLDDTGKPWEDIRDGLFKIGIYHAELYYEDLVAVISLVREEPGRIKNLMVDVYPQVAQSMGSSATIVKSHVQSIIHRGIGGCRETGRHWGYYSKGGLLDHKATAKKFIAYFLQNLEEETYNEPGG